MFILIVIQGDLAKSFRVVNRVFWCKKKCDKNKNSRYASSIKAYGGLFQNVLYLRKFDLSQSFNLRNLIQIGFILLVELSVNLSLKIGASKNAYLRLPYNHQANFYYCQTNSYSQTMLKILNKLVVFNSSLFPFFLLLFDSVLWSHLDQNPPHKNLD